MQREGPTMRRGKSEQVVETPGRLISAVTAKWGSLAIDLAATKENTKCEEFVTPEEDTFTISWFHRLKGRIGWLNPEFDHVEPWLLKCRAEAGLGARLIVLTRGDVGTNWFWNIVYTNAAVYALQPRLTFVGHTKPYPFPLIISTWNLPFKEKFSPWRWDV